MAVNRNINMCLRNTSFLSPGKGQTPETFSGRGKSFHIHIGEIPFNNPLASFQRPTNIKNHILISLRSRIIISLLLMLTRLYVGERVIVALQAKDFAVGQRIILAIPVSVIGLPAVELVIAVPLAAPLKRPETAVAYVAVGRSPALALPLGPLPRF